MIGRGAAQRKAEEVIPAAAGIHSFVDHNGFPPASLCKNSVNAMAAGTLCG
jgi:hypothetical protein